MRAMSTAREVERETFERRDRLASTLDELSASLTPGRVLDEVLSYAKGGGGNFLMGMGKSAASNPLPTLLISTGCAMFLSGRGAFGALRGGRSAERAEPPRENRPMHGNGRDHNRPDSPGVAAKAVGAVSAAASSVSETIAGTASGIGNAASGLADSASDMTSRLTQTAKDAAATVSDRANEAGDYVSSVGESAREYVGGAADRARQTGTQVKRKATLMGQELQGRAATLFEEYPLVVAAGGLIVGAALASMLPRTRIEDQYLGRTSDTLKDAFTESAADTVERVAESVENVVGVVAAKADEEDLVGAAKGSIEELTEKVGRTWQAGKDAVNEELQPQK